MHGSILTPAWALAPLRALAQIRGHVLTEWSVGLTLLTGTWMGVSAVLGAYLPNRPPADERITIEEVQAWRSSYQLHVVRLNPCTDETVELELTLTMDIRARQEGEDAQVLVQAILASAPSATAPDAIIEAREQFGFFAPLYGKPMRVHDLRATLLGQAVPSELMVGVEQGVGPSGLLQVQPGPIRVACT
jgi:hypothetical protein